MKKSGILLLTVFYFIVTSGLVINFHYCGGKLKKISWIEHKDCCCGSKKKAKGCCKEKTVICKVKDSQKPASKTIVPGNASKQITAGYIVLHFLMNNTPDIQTLPDYHPPGNRYTDPVFLLNRNFRI